MPIKIIQKLSVPKHCKCLFYYAEYDTDEYKRQGKEFIKVNKIITSCVNIHIIILNRLLLIMGSVASMKWYHN